MRLAAGTRLGAYEITGICDAGRHNDDEGDRDCLLVTAPGFGPALKLDLPPPDIGRVAHVEVHLERAVRIAGRVLEAGSAKPVAGAPVILWSEGSTKNLHYGDGKRYEHPLRPWVIGRQSSGVDGEFGFEAGPAKSVNAPRLRHHAMLPLTAGYVGTVPAGRAPVFRAYPEDRAGHEDRSGSQGEGAQDMAALADAAVDVHLEPTLGCRPCRGCRRCRRAVAEGDRRGH